MIDNFLKFPDNSLRDMQYKIIDVIDPLSALHENNSIMFEPLADETLNLHRVKTVPLFGSFSSKDICPSFSKRREKVLAKFNPVPASLGMSISQTQESSFFGMVSKPT